MEFRLFQTHTRIHLLVHTTHWRRFAQSYLIQIWPALIVWIPPLLDGIPCSLSSSLHFLGAAVLRSEPATNHAKGLKKAINLKTFNSISKGSRSVLRNYLCEDSACGFHKCCSGEQCATASHQLSRNQYVNSGFL